MSETKKVVLDSPEGFFEALRSSDISTAIGILRAVTHNPQAALAFGKFQDQDVLDVLIHQSNQSEGFTYQQLVLGTIAAFDDPRALNRIKKALYQWEHPEIIQMAVQRIALEPIEEVINDIRPLLMQDHSSIHCSAAADMLSDYPKLTDAERLRVTLANTTGLDVGPELNARTAKFWMKELGGWYGPQAREVLNTRPEDSFASLTPHWDHLDADTKLWLLILGRKRSPLELVPFLQKALADSDIRIIAGGLEGIIALGDAKSIFVDVVTPFLVHEDRIVRMLAIQAGAKTDWQLYISRESDPELIAAGAKRLAEVNGESAAALLAHLLAHESWIVRAGATQAFVYLGPQAIPLLREHALSEDQGTRVAAVQALVELNDFEWLEENLLTP